MVLLLVQQKPIRAETKEFSHQYLSILKSNGKAAEVLLDLQEMPQEGAARCFESQRNSTGGEEWRVGEAEQQRFSARETRRGGAEQHSRGAHS